MPLRDEVRLEIEQRSVAGESVAAIAQACGRSYGSVYAVLRRRQGIVLRPFGDLGRLRFLARKGLIP